MNGECWDNRRRSDDCKRENLEEALWLYPHPHLWGWWTGPTNPQEAAACDRVMIALGTILAQRQFPNHYDTDAIYRAMRGIRKG